MKITYRTLKNLINYMDESQLDSFLIVETTDQFNSTECSFAELRIAGTDHNCGLNYGDPVIVVHSSEEKEMNDYVRIAENIGLLNDWMNLPNKTKQPTDFPE